jgi:hypothetical protein
MHIDLKNPNMFKQDSFSQERLARVDKIQYNLAKQACEAGIELIPCYPFSTQNGCCCPLPAPVAGHSAGHPVIALTDATSKWYRVAAWLSACPGCELRCVDADGSLCFIDICLFDEPTKPHTFPYYAWLYQQQRRQRQHMVECNEQVSKVSTLA